MFVLIKKRKTKTWDIETFTQIMKTVKTPKDFKNPKRCIF